MQEYINPRVTLNHIGRVTSQKNWGMREHVHTDFHEFILVLRGSLKVRIRGMTLVGQRGDVLYYPARQAHHEQSIGNDPLDTIFIAWRTSLPVDEIIAANDGNIPLLVTDRNNRIRLLMQWLYEIYPPGNQQSTQQLNLLADALVYEYAHLALSPEQNLIHKIKTYIQHHLNEAIDLDVLAQEAGLSKYHFSREFKRLSGISPMTYVRLERVEAARSLLLSTPLTLQAIAAQVGFADEFQFSRVFRRVTGSPPSHIR